MCVLRSLLSKALKRNGYNKFNLQTHIDTIALYCMLLHPCEVHGSVRTLRTACLSAPDVREVACKRKQRAWPETTCHSFNLNGQGHDCKSIMVRASFGPLYQATGSSTAMSCGTGNSENQWLDPIDREWLLPAIKDTTAAL